MKDTRGFSVYSKFKDRYLSTVIVKESSIAFEKCCWILVENDGKDPRSNLVTDGAIHLTVPQAKKVIKALQAWIDDKNTEPEGVAPQKGQDEN